MAGDLGHMPSTSQRNGIDIATARRLFGGVLPNWLKTLANSIYGGAHNSVELLLAAIYRQPRDEDVGEAKEEEGDTGVSWQSRLGRRQESNKAGNEDSPV